jgi:hypothetical protein
VKGGLLLVTFPLCFRLQRTLLLTIFYSIKAGRGECAKYPLLGNVAARMLHIDFSMRYQSVPPEYPPQYPPPQMPPAVSPEM